MDTMQASPNLDRTLTYTARWIQAPSRCRLRVFEDHRVAVVTELDDNPGTSVTNAIEDVAEAIEAVLPGVLFHDHQAAALPASWQLVEHYPHGRSLPPTIDLVRFEGRDAAGHLVGPKWRHVGGDEKPWLWEALAP